MPVLLPVFARAADRGSPSAGQPDKVCGIQLDVQAPASTGHEDRAEGNADSSSTVGDGWRWPSGEIPPRT